MLKPIRLVIRQQKLWLKNVTTITSFVLDSQQRSTTTRVENLRINSSEGWSNFVALIIVVRHPTTRREMGRWSGSIELCWICSVHCPKTRSRNGKITCVKSCMRVTACVTVQQDILPFSCCLGGTLVYQLTSFSRPRHHQPSKSIHSMWNNGDRPCKRLTN